MNTKKVLGVVLILTALFLIVFWELWGRAKFSYDTIAVLKEDVDRNVVITREMLKERKIVRKDSSVILYSEVDKIIGLKTNEYIPKGVELVQEYFSEADLIPDDSLDSYVFSIPEDWVYLFPEGVKRGDEIYFYSNGEYVTEGTVYHVRDSLNTEVTFMEKDRFRGSSNVSQIEVLLSKEKVKLLDLLYEKGNKFLLVYE